MCGEELIEDDFIQVKKGGIIISLSHNTELTKDGIIYPYYERLRMYVDEYYDKPDHECKDVKIDRIEDIANGCART